MTTIVISVNVTEKPDRDDKRTMRHVVSIENARRQALTTPEPLLLLEPMVELKRSYEQCLSRVIGNIHAQYTKESLAAVDSDEGLKTVRTLWLDSSPEQRRAAIAALNAGAE